MSQKVPAGEWGSEARKGMLVTLSSLVFVTLWTVASVHGILQARILGWVAIPFSGDLPSPGIKPRSPILQADILLSETPGKPQKGRDLTKSV